MWLLALALGGQAVFAPAPAALGVRHEYRIAPIKPSDDWSLFVEELEEFKSNMPDAAIVASRTIFSMEDCDRSADCDVVTIDRQKSTYYTFRIKNGNQAHRPLYGCSSCSPNTPTSECPAVAKSDFVGFMIFHDKCHQDASRCRESPCQQ